MKKAGFSLIEILIATSILLVIVMMVSMVFQQQSAAFQSGEDRVKGQAAIRNVVGMMVRDLSLAVDPESITNAPESNSFGARSIKFFATTGEAGVGVDGNEENSTKDCAVLQYISYSFSGGKVKREVTGYKLRNDWKWTKAGTASAYLNNDNNLLDKSAGISFTTSDSSKFPSNVTIKAVYAGSSHAGFVRGESAGPDRDFNNQKDNIYVGGKP